MGTTFAERTERLRRPAAPRAPLRLLDDPNCEPLSRELERELVARAKQGDREARDRVILAVTRFVYGKACQRSSFRLLPEDLFQEAMARVVECFELFDPEHDVRFLSFADRWITWKILRVGQNNSVVRIPWSRDEEEKHIRAERRKFVSVDSDHLSSLPDDAAEREDEEGWLESLIEQLLSRVSPRSGEILRLRASGLSGRQIGERLGLTRARIAQLEAKALNAIRTSLATTLTSTQREAIAAYFAGETSDRNIAQGVRYIRTLNRPTSHWRSRWRRQNDRSLSTKIKPV